MLDSAIVENRDVRGPAANIDQCCTQFLFVVRQYGVARRELLQHDVLNLQPTTLHALDDVLSGACGAGHHVHSGFEAHARHTDGVVDTFLAIDDEFLRQHVENALISRNRHRPGCVDNAFDITATNLSIPNGDDAMRVQAANVAARDARVHRLDFATCHQFGFFNRSLNRVHRRFDIDDYAAL